MLGILFTYTYNIYILKVLGNETRNNVKDNTHYDGIIGIAVVFIIPCVHKYTVLYIY